MNPAPKAMGASQRNSLECPLELWTTEPSRRNRRMKKYPPIEPGQVVKIPWRKEDYKMACCDCCLVHRLRFKVKGGVLEMQAWRDNRATAQLRRKRPSENGMDEGRRTQKIETTTEAV